VTCGGLAESPPPLSLLTQIFHSQSSSPKLRLTLTPGTFYLLDLPFNMSGVIEEGGLAMFTFLVQVAF